MSFPSKFSPNLTTATDEELVQRLSFVKEVGCGNWGSVWLCEPKSSEILPAFDAFDRTLKKRLAVKLVHRDKESKTSVARVKSLWNEMKIIRKLQDGDISSHPSIIPFYSFLLTPSYAIITMAYHPDLVTVQVSEPHARVWFRYLLSAIQFLHKRGVVHNDIKPANILLSAKGIPVLLPRFISKFAYGTPEYLAPERARGIPHDTRKSDIWSLGCSFFEILIGRTPFEESDQDQCVTEEDLQKYWGRTLRGKWVGTWKMSKGMERLLKRMLSPNADLRCTADEAMKDIYWVQVQQKDQPGQVNEHRRSASYSSSIVFEKDWAKLAAPEPKTQHCSPLASSSSIRRGENDGKAGRDKELHLPPGLESPKNHVSRTLSKSKSQGRVATNNEALKNIRKRVPAHVDLSPIKGSPPVSPAAQARKNTASHNGRQQQQRAPLGPIHPRDTNNILAPSHQQRVVAGKPSFKELNKRHSKVGMLDELANGPPGARKVQNRGKENHVSQRVRDWERERERLREISRLEEIERERDAELSDSSDTEPEVVDITPELEKIRVPSRAGAKEAQVQDRVEERRVSSAADLAANMSASRSVMILSEPSTPAATLNTTLLPEVIVSPTGDPSPPRTSRPQAETLRRPNSAGGRSTFKHAIKRSIDKTFQMYKTSSLGGRNYHSRNLSVDQHTDAESRGSRSERESWEDEECVRAVKSSLPVVKHAVHNEQVAADNRVDRLTLWMKNVEQVVEDARQTFSTGKEAPLPPLPLPPATRTTNLSSSQTRSNRSSRLPRRILAANQIFSESGDQSTEMSSFVTSVYASPDTSTSPDNLNDSSALSVPLLQTTPSRQRRATVSTRSPDPVVSGPIEPSFDIENGSSSKRKEKSKSHGNLFQLHIAPAATLGAELDKRASASSPCFDIPKSPRLSAVVDREIFIAPPVRSSEDLIRNVSSSSPSSQRNDKSFDELTESPLRVEPYAPRPSLTLQPVPDTPTQKRVEGVYDRFLMATSGVKRLGKNHRAFYTVRRPLQMPPPVASDDQARTVTVDEMGMLSCSPAEERGGVTVLKDENNGTAALVKRALKAIVPSKTNRRLSRMN
ncbi:hypothetical protein BT96DRAFT_998101 [Gymnopus androsaceus JB14]|uniref:Protein kinase domain-containing protein n=1 Tax=Gymnopus androsaceus JB14 TaxID=1447944 RepID=A0A6A4HCR2_9AGAR|nr:hypothetical protein BT96DRAFT_998101 [Gymnopus androsaceus JB14]